MTGHFFLGGQHSGSAILGHLIQHPHDLDLRPGFAASRGLPILIQPVGDSLLR